ncbi:MAG TPA: DUF4038 domain-containing protein [Bryobacteraceae bacterium]|nr:DUF4038 domain-containing protein [Bryobacteraceae bacterium]HPT25020.1 DUF4038 domain-containing protein [Bryobacteraceae bacterium]
MKWRLGLIFATCCLAAQVRPQAPQYGVFEQVLTAAKPPQDPLAARVRVTFTSREATETVEAYWDGAAAWKVRYSPMNLGEYAFAVASPDVELEPRSGAFTSVPNRGRTALDRQGPPVVSPNRRHFVHAGSGQPWFWLADTAWSGPMLATTAEWDEYLATRVKQRFTAVQFVTTQYRAAYADEQGRTAFQILEGKLAVDPAFFSRLDQRVMAMRRAGLVPVAVMLWALSSKVGESPGETLSVAFAAQLARYIQARYHAFGTIWFLGGDGDYRAEKQDRWKEIGRAVFPADLARRPVSLHPRGMQEPWEGLKDEPWLGFLVYQSGHGSSPQKWQWQAWRGPAQGWRLTPPRPVLDAEPNYEGHVSYQNKLIDAFAVRRAAWYALLSAPLAGVTYGAHGVWPWMREPGPVLNHPRTGDAPSWRDCMNWPGAQSMKVAADVLASIAWTTLRPDPTLAAPNQVVDDFSNYIAAASSEDLSLALLYLPDNPAASLDLTRFARPVQSTWVSPSSGASTPGPRLPAQPAVTVKPPGPGDWLLLLRR